MMSYGYILCMSCRGINCAFSFTCVSGDRERAVIIVARLGAGFVSDPKRPAPFWGPFTFTLNRHMGALSAGVKRPGLDADDTHLVPRLRMSGAVLPLHHMSSLRQHGKLTFCTFTYGCCNFMKACE